MCKTNICNNFMLSLTWLEEYIVEWSHRWAYYRKPYGDAWMWMILHALNPWFNGWASYNLSWNPFLGIHFRLVCNFTYEKFTWTKLCKYLLCQRHNKDNRRHTIENPKLFTLLTIFSFSHNNDSRIFQFHIVGLQENDRNFRNRQKKRLWFLSSMDYKEAICVVLF